MFGRVPKPTCIQTVLFFLFFFGERTRNPPQKKFDEYECDPMSCALCSFEWTYGWRMESFAMRMSMHSNHSQDHTWNGWGIGETNTKWRSDNIEGQHKEQMQQDATHKWLLEWFPKHNRKCMNNSERCEKQKPSKSKNKRSFSQIHEEDQQDWWSRSGGEECHDRRGQNLHDNFRHWERTWNFLLTAMVDIVEKQAEKTRKETQPKSVRKLSNISMEATCCTQIVEPTPWRASAELPATFERDAACEARMIEQSKYCDKH